MILVQIKLGQMFVVTLLTQEKVPDSKEEYLGGIYPWTEGAKISTKTHQTTKPILLNSPTDQLPLFNVSEEFNDSCSVFAKQ